MIRDLLAEGAEAGAVRTDIAPSELASYRLHAISGGLNGLPRRSSGG